MAERRKRITRLVTHGSAVALLFVVCGGCAAEAATPADSAEVKSASLRLPDGVTYFSRTQWLGRSASGATLRRRSLDYIFLHHTAGWGGQRADAGARSAYEFHTRKRRYSDVGYHYIIDKWGNVAQGRPSHLQGAGLTGLNDRSIHIAFLGNFEASGKRPTDVALRSAGVIARFFLTRSPDLQIYGHGYPRQRGVRQGPSTAFVNPDPRNTDCPGNHWKGFINDGNFRREFVDSSSTSTGPSRPPVTPAPPRAANPYDGSLTAAFDELGACGRCLDHYFRTMGIDEIDGDAVGTAMEYRPGGGYRGCVSCDNEMSLADFDGQFGFGGEAGKAMQAVIDTWGLEHPTLACLGCTNFVWNDVENDWAAYDTAVLPCRNAVKHGTRICR